MSSTERPATTTESASDSVIEPIPGVTHVPATFAQSDDNYDSRWTFAFDNGYGAQVDDDGAGVYSLKATYGGSPVKNSGRYTLVAEDLQVELDRINALQPKRTRLEDTQFRHVALGDALAAIAATVPDAPIDDFDARPSGLHVHVGDGWDEKEDRREVLHRVAEAVGIQDGWDPQRLTGRWEYRYRGTWQGLQLTVAAEEPRVQAPPPAPAPRPLPAAASITPVPPEAPPAVTGAS